MTVDLGTGRADGHGADRLYSIEDVWGGDGPDAIYGDDRANDLQGGGRGPDELYGDCYPGVALHGGPGRDAVSFAYAYEAGGVTIDLV